MKQTGAVIAAAGLSSRMGDFKPLLPFGGECIARHLTEMLKRIGVSPIVIVTGYRGKELQQQLSGTDVLFVENTQYASTEMLDSLKLGFKALCGQCSEVLVMPVDVPAVTEDTVRKIINAHSPIVRTSYSGRRGHPVKLSSDMMEAVLAYNGENGLKGFLKSCSEQIMDVEVADEGSFVDADTKEEYRRLLQLEGSRGQGYPDGDSLKWLLETSRMPEDLRRHSEAVSRKALSMAVKLQETGVLLDLNLVRSASLLHDIRKGSRNHAAAGAKLLKESGYSRAAEIVRQHHWLDAVPGYADETLIVYLADKLIQGDQEVSIDERFEKSLNKCLGNSEALRWHSEKYRQAKEAWQVWEKSFVS